MIVHRLLIATETILLAIPMILLSGFWMLNMMFLIEQSYPFTTGFIVLMYLHGFLALTSFLSVVSLIYMSVYFVKLGYIETTKKHGIIVILILSGIAISVIGVAAFLYDRLWGLKTDPIQMFSTYLLGALLWIPAGHIIYLYRANKALKRTPKGAA